MRNFGSTSIKEKILTVYQVVAWEKIPAVARKHRISKPSVYAWTGEGFRYSGAIPKIRKTGT